MFSKISQMSTPFDRLRRQTKTNLELSKHTVKAAQIDNKSLEMPFHIYPAISAKDADEVIQFVDNGGLGQDPSSKHFMHREKCIRFILTYDETFFCLSQNYFLQASCYNDFSGGYKRIYKLLPESLLQGPLKEVILQFIRYNNLPNLSILLVQLQASYSRGKTFYFHHSSHQCKLVTTS